MRAEYGGQYPAERMAQRLNLLASTARANARDSRLFKAGLITPEGKRPMWVVLCPNGETIRHPRKRGRIPAERMANRLNAQLALAIAIESDINGKSAKRIRS